MGDWRPIGDLLYGRNMGGPWETHPWENHGSRRIGLPRVPHGFVTSVRFTPISDMGHP